MTGGKSIVIENIFSFPHFSERFRLFRSLIGKQGEKSLNTGGDLYGIPQALLSIKACVNLKDRGTDS